MGVEGLGAGAGPLVDSDPMARLYEHFTGPLSDRKTALHWLVGNMW